MSRVGRWLAAMSGFPYVEASLVEDTTVTMPPSAGAAATGLAPFTFPEGGVSKSTILTIPTLQRAHDLTISLVADLPLVPFRLTWDEALAEMREERLKPLPWHSRPDPGASRQSFLGMLASDLWAYGRAYARITSRYVATEPGQDWPASFTYMAYEDIKVKGPRGWKSYQGLRPGCEVTYQGSTVTFRDVVEFVNPLTPVAAGWRSIQTALALEKAVNRFSDVEMPSGWLQQVDGDPLGADELTEAAAVWGAARRENATGALNQFFTFHEATYNPDNLQLVEARTYQSLEMARLGNVPPYLVGAPSGTGMTYQNAQTARSDLVDFGAGAIIAAIDQAFSGPQVSPYNQAVRLNVNAWLVNPFSAEQPITEQDVPVRNREAPPAADQTSGQDRVERGSGQSRPDPKGQPGRPQNGVKR